MQISTSSRVLSSPTKQRQRKRSFDELQTQTRDGATVSKSHGEYSGGTSPPWEALELLAGRMDGKTLAAASCVSKTWSLCFSSEHLWRSLFTTHQPSLSAAAPPPRSYKRLFSAAESAAKRRRCGRQPPQPKISLSDLTFTLLVRHGTTNLLNVVKQGKDIQIPTNGTFRFEIGLDHELVFATTEEIKVTWHVVYREWEAVFTMMDCVRSVEKAKWFSEKLPASGNCVFERGSGLAAEVELGLIGELGDNRPVRVEKIGLGIMNTVDLRHLNQDDGLRYLQHFLLEQE